VRHRPLPLNPTDDGQPVRLLQRRPIRLEPQTPAGFSILDRLRTGSRQRFRYLVPEKSSATYFVAAIPQHLVR
jgi:hypothetical protein